MTAATTRRKTAQIPAVLRPEDITVVVDTREQLPLELAPFRTCEGTLVTGDYSIQGLEHLVTVERKSLPDLVGCVGSSRDRFERELQRMMGFRFAAVVVEASWDQLEMGQWRGQVSPKAVVGSVLSWSARFCPIILAGSRQGAETAVSGFLWHAARHCLMDLKPFAATVRRIFNAS